MTNKERKYRKRDITQLSAEGNLSELKKFFLDDLKDVNKEFIDTGIYYSIRNGHIKVVEYLLNITEHNIDYFIVKYNIISVVVNRGMSINRRMYLYKYLSDNCEQDIASVIIIKYLQLRKLNVLLECIELFRNKVNIIELISEFVEKNKKQNETFSYELVKIIRSEKLRNILRV